MRCLALILCLLAPRLNAAAADPAPFPIQDARALRELQSHVFGKPSLDAQAPRPEALLALAELGSASTRSSGDNLSADDKAALFSLLQRYRDELLALGMDVAELDSQLKALEARSGEVERRLSKLYVKDGLKIHGRFYSFYDDLHLLGNATLPAVSPNALIPPPTIIQGSLAKPAGQGLRAQIGAVHGELMLEGTRGPISALSELDVVAPLGLDVATFGFRRVYMEIRMPVTLQFGDLDAALSPLTLWRNDQDPWFEPEPLKSRRERDHADLHMVEDHWRVTGARASSELHVFDALRIDLQSITAIASNPTIGGTAYVDYQTLAGGSLDRLGTRYATYLEAWSLGFVVEPSVRINYNGTLFWDVTSTNAFSAGQVYAGMQEAVHDGQLQAAFGPVSIEAEAALSSYIAPRLTWAAQVDPLTGTAMIASVRWNATDGYVKLFGRDVSPGYHAAGAQGRTVDAAYQYLGPFLNEQDQVGATGLYGLDPLMRITHASRLNDRLIPPGTYFIGTTITAGPWVHLLNYEPGEEIDANGPATPNRAGFGTELQWKLFNGGIKPMASYEAFQNSDIVTDASNNTLAAFSMTRIRAGLELDLEPWTSWPIRFGAGSTSTDSHDGMKDAAGKDYALTTSILDAGVQIGTGRSVGLDLGYRLMSAKGQNERVSIPGTDGQSWDIEAVGAWWKPMPEMVVDLVYSVGHNATLNVPASNLEIDQALLRLTTEF